MNRRVIRLEWPNVNFVYTTDWHLTDVPPGKRRDDYRSAILNKICFQSALAKKVNGVGLCGGDVFHVKHPRSRANSHGLVEEIVTTLKTFPLEQVFGTVGNHDIQYDRLDTLPNQPLGVVIASGAYHNLAEQPVLFTNNDGSVSVLVESVGYCGTINTLEWLKNSGPRPEGVNYRVGIVHAYGKAGDRTNLYTEPVIGYNELADLDYDVLLWGHDHSRKETETVGNVTHVNLGSLARAAFSTDEVDRPVCATILSFGADGIKMKEKHVPVQTLEVAFVAADKPIEQVRKQEAVTNFFNAMDEAVEGIESSDPREVLIQLCADNKSVQDLAIELCEL